MIPTDPDPAKNDADPPDLCPDPQYCLQPSEESIQHCNSLYDFVYFFLFLWVIFAVLVPGSKTLLGPVGTVPVPKIVHKGGRSRRYVSSLCYVIPQNQGAGMKLDTVTVPGTISVPAK